MVVELTFKQLALLFFKRGALWKHTTHERLLIEELDFFNNIHSIIKDELKNELGSDWMDEFFGGSVYYGIGPIRMLPLLDKLKNPKQNLVYGIDFTEKEFELFGDVLSIRYNINSLGNVDIRAAAAHINKLWDELEDEIRRSIRVW